MTVFDCANNLCEDLSGIFLAQPLFLAYVVEHVAFLGVLHDQHKRLLRLEDFEEFDDTGMSDSLEDVDLLQNLPLGELISHVLLINGLHSHFLSSQLMLAQYDLPESSFTQPLSLPIKMEVGVGVVVVLLLVIGDILFELLDLLYFASLLSYVQG